MIKFMKNNDIGPVRYQASEGVTREAHIGAAVHGPILNI